MSGSPRSRPRLHRWLKAPILPDLFDRVELGIELDVVQPERVDADREEKESHHESMAHDEDRATDHPAHDALGQQAFADDRVEGQSQNGLGNPEDSDRKSTRLNS